MTTNLINIKRIRETNTNIWQLWVKWIIPWKTEAMRTYSTSSERRGNTSQFISWGQYYPETKTRKNKYKKTTDQHSSWTDAEIFQILANQIHKYRNKNNS